MRYEVIRGVPLHDTENDTSQPQDLAHRLVIGDHVDIDPGIDITKMARVKVTVVEPEPRRTGWVTTNESLKLLAPDPDIDPSQFYDLLNLITVDKTDQRYLFALAFAESGLKNVASPVSGSDGFGPFQYTSARWTELVDLVGARLNLRPEDRTIPEKQARLAVEEAADAMKKVETALSRPARRNELYLLYVLPTVAAEAFLSAVKNDPTTPVNTISIDTILTGVPDPASFVEQHSKLLKSANGIATVAEALDLAAGALQPGLDRTVELDPPPREMVSLPDGLTVFEAKCLTYMPRLIERFGLTPEQAAGVFGNLGTESAGFTAFHEKGQPEGKGGYGWAQWTASRRVDFFNWCREQTPALAPESDEGSYGFLCFELGKRPHSAAITALKSTNTLEDAVEAFEREYEKAGIKGMPSRISWARKALAIFTNPPEQEVVANQADTTAGSGPKWVMAGLEDIGFHEIGNNRGIQKFIDQAGFGSLGNRWCAIWANAKLAKSLVPGSGSALAASFRNHPNFRKLDGPARGAIVVWDHHVGFYMGQSSSGLILTLGGNQSDSVCEAFQRFNDEPDFWWPKSEPMPEVGAILVALGAGGRGGRVT